MASSVSITSDLDAFAARLAQEFDAALVTGDPEFRGLGQSLRVAWLGAD